jgi:hypothetical protein
MDYVHYANSLILGCAQIFFGLFVPLIGTLIVSGLFFLMFYGPSETYSYSVNERLWKDFESQRKWHNPLTWTSWEPIYAIPFLLFSIPLTIWLLLLSTVYIDEAVNSATSIYSQGKVRISQSFDAYTAYRNKEDGKNIEVVVSTKLERFTLVAINPPKHMYVDLKSETGHIYENLYVSKHCNNLPKTGDEFNIMVTTFYTKDDPSHLKVRFADLHSTLCGA